MCVNRKEKLCLKNVFIQYRQDTILIRNGLIMARHAEARVQVARVRLLREGRRRGLCRCQKGGELD